MFGQTSTMHSSSSLSAALAASDDERDEMDWAPLPGGANARGLLDNEAWMRPQRLFAPSQPTGLEGLLENARLREDGQQQAGEVGVPIPIRKGGAKKSRARMEAGGIYGVALLVALLAAAGLVLSTGSWVVWKGTESG